MFGLSLTYCMVPSKALKVEKMEPLEISIGNPPGNPTAGLARFARHRRLTRLEGADHVRRLGASGRRPPGFGVVLLPCANGALLMVHPPLGNKTRPYNYCFHGEHGEIMYVFSPLLLCESLEGSSKQVRKTQRRVV